MARVLARTVAKDATLTMLPPQVPCRYKPIKLLQENKSVFCFVSIFVLFWIAASLTVTFSLFHTLIFLPL